MRFIGRIMRAFDDALHHSDEGQPVIEGYRPDTGNAKRLVPVEWERNEMNVRTLWPASPELLAATQGVAEAIDAHIAQWLHETADAGQHASRTATASLPPSDSQPQTDTP